MKHVKLFEQFISEAKTSFSPDVVDEVKKMGEEYLNLRLAFEVLFKDYYDTRTILDYQLIAARRADNDQLVAKLEKQKELNDAKRDKAYKERDKVNKFKEDALKDPEIKKFIKNVGDLFSRAEDLAEAQTIDREHSKFVAALKKIDKKDFSANQLRDIEQFIEGNENLIKKNKEKLEDSLKGMNAIFAKMKDLKENPGKAGKASAEKEKKITKADVEELLEVTPEKITVKPNEITVVVSGNELGFDDDQYYETTWYISDKRVEQGVFKDRQLRDQITGDQYPDDVDSLEAFMGIVNTSKGFN